jgi:Tol biopolymer transport system component
MPSDVTVVTPAEASRLAFSNDGHWLVFVGTEKGTSRLYTRSLDQFEVREIPGTEGATNPVFSPDSQWLGYFNDDKLFKVPIDGGPSQTLTSFSGTAFGADWDTDGTIIFNREWRGLWQVSERGGEPELLVSPDASRGEYDLLYPHVLPKGQAVLYTTLRGLLPETSEIGVLDLTTGARETLIESASWARYVPTGHLIFGRAAGVFLVPFDLERREVTGPPVPTPQSILYDREVGIAHLAFSPTGDLAFIPGRESPQNGLVSVDMEGNQTSLFKAQRAFMYPRYSPDGRRLAVTIHDAEGSHIWIANLSTGALTRFTSQGSNLFPLWTPDGERITFYSDRSGGSAIYVLSADGSEPPEKLVEGDINSTPIPCSWAPDGSSLVYFVAWQNPSDPETRTNTLWRVSVSGDREPEELGSGHAAAVSPDNRWLAHADAGQIFVRPLDGHGGRQQLSTDGGNKPVWSPDGRHVYYRKGGNIMRVTIETTEDLVAQAPEVLFDSAFAEGTFMIAANFDVAPDGKSFVMVEADEGWGRSSEVRLILDWFDEVLRLAPADR